MSGMGFAIGLERLLSLAEEEGWTPKNSEKAQVYVISLGEVGSVPLKIAETLRKEGIAAEVNLVGRSLKAQFKSAERSGAEVIVIVGESELKEGKVNIKNSRDGRQDTVALEELIAKTKEMLG